MKVKKEIPEVVTVRTWKEYIEESVLIIFSVVLALFLTELFQKIHEDGRLRQVVHELRQELISNRKAEEIQLRYHLQVLKNIDAALANPAIGQQFINNGALNLKVIAPVILVKENYLGRVVDRAPELLTRYQEAIEKLGSY
jgi:hypothetical protein